MIEINKFNYSLGTKRSSNKMTTDQNITSQPKLNEQGISFYGNTKLPDAVKTALQSKALSFGTKSKDMEGALIQIDPSSGFDMNDFADLFQLMAPETRALTEDVIQKLKPVSGFLGRKAIRSIKAILANPEKENIFNRILTKFTIDKSNSDFDLAGGIADTLENYDTANHAHRKIIDLCLSKNIHSSSDIADLIKNTNPQNERIIIKILEKVNFQELINWLEVKLIADEILKDPKKEALVDKLLEDFKHEKSSLSGILSITEIYETDNPVHKEMLDFLINTQKDFWGLFISQVLEKCTPTNKDKIKQIVNKTNKTGFDAAKEIINQINQL